MGRARTTESHVGQHRRMLAAYYNSVHRSRVTDVNIEMGTCNVNILDAGDFPRSIPIPLLGFSFPPQKTPTDKNYRRTSWGVYIPQVNDIVILAFDAIGNAHCLGYSYANYPAMKSADNANEERGGIGWADASGKRLKAGDWSFKSAGGSFLYLSDRVSLSCGSHAIRMEQSQATNEITLQSCLVHQRYGECAEVRAGAARRLLLPTDTVEQDLYGAFGTIAQEHTNYVRRGSLTVPPTFQALMVQESFGEVIDDLTRMVMVPAASATCADLVPALVGSGVRSLKLVKDDLTGMIDQYAEITDNLGNHGVSAKLATGFMWNTPLAAWTIMNLSTSLTSTAKHDVIVGAGYTLVAATASLLASGTFSATAGTTLGLTAGADLSATAGANLNVTAGAAVSITAGTSFTMSSVYDFGFTAGASLNLNAGTVIGLTATSLLLNSASVSLGGTGAVESLVLGTSFMAAFTDFLTGAAGLSVQMGAIAAACNAPPLGPLGLSVLSPFFTAVATAAGVLAGQGAALLSTVSKTV